MKKKTGRFMIYAGSIIVASALSMAGVVINDSKIDHTKEICILTRNFGFIHQLAMINKSKINIESGIKARYFDKGYIVDAADGTKIIVSGPEEITLDSPSYVLTLENSDGLEEKKVYIVPDGYDNSGIYDVPTNRIKTLKPTEVNDSIIITKENGDGIITNPEEDLNYDDETVINVLSLNHN